MDTTLEEMILEGTPELGTSPFLRGPLGKASPCPLGSTPSASPVIYFHRYSRGISLRIPSDFHSCEKLEEEGRC